MDQFKADFRKVEGGWIGELLESADGDICGMGVIPEPRKLRDVLDMIVACIQDHLVES